MEATEGAASEEATEEGLEEATEAVLEVGTADSVAREDGEVRAGGVRVVVRPRRYGGTFRAAGFASVVGCTLRHRPRAHPNLDKRATRRRPRPRKLRWRPAQSQLSLWPSQSRQLHRLTRRKQASGRFLVQTFVRGSAAAIGLWRREGHGRGSTRARLLGVTEPLLVPSPSTQGPLVL